MADRITNEDGTKARSGKDNTAFLRAYSDWHRTIGRDYYANDVDWLEWRIGPSGPEIVALIELTFSEETPGNSYCEAALARFKRDGQYTITNMVSGALAVPAYFVIARYDLKVFRVCRLRDEEWRGWDEPHYREWIKNLKGN